MTYDMTMMGSFSSSQRAEGAMTGTVFADVMMLAGALALLAAVIALPLWW
jgi:hypothetical protein